MTTWTTTPTVEEMANVIKLHQQQIAELQAEIPRAQAASKQAGLNAKVIVGQKAGKACDFDGRQDNWHDWAFRFKRHVDGIRTGAEELMEWAATSSDEIKKDDLEFHSIPEAQGVSEVMYCLTTLHT